jgi:hypothetical protein
VAQISETVTIVNVSTEQIADSSGFIPMAPVAAGAAAPGGYIKVKYDDGRTLVRAVENASDLDAYKAGHTATVLITPN